jgi:O-antigen/teichoic acid export membrane protein
MDRWLLRSVDNELPRGNLRKHTIRGITFAYTAYAAEKIAVFGTTVVLANVLAPSTFGTFASIMLLILFIDTFRDFGFTDALVYLDDPDGLAGDTTFWFTLVTSGFLATVTFLVAPILSRHLFEGQYTDVLRSISLWFLINGLGLTHEAVLGKRLSFSTRYAIDITSTVAKATLSICLAVTGFGIWSLISGIIGGAAVKTSLRWLLTSWRPRFRFSISKWQELYRYGRHVVAVALNDYVTEKIDQITIVWLLGEVQLAFYYIALRFPEMLLYHFNVVLTRILYPVFASLRSDLSALTDFLLGATRYTALITVPIGLGMALTADAIVQSLLGSKWMPTAEPLTTLSLAAAMQSLMWSCGDMFKAIGRPELTTRIAFLELLVTVPTVVLLVALTNQLWMAGLALLLAATISNIIRARYTQEILKLSMADLVRPLVPPLVAGGALIVAVIVARLIIESAAAPALAVYVIVGAAAYIGTLASIDRAGLIAALSLLRSLGRRDEIN